MLALDSAGLLPKIMPVVPSRTVSPAVSVVTQVLPSGLKAW